MIDLRQYFQPELIAEKQKESNIFSVLHSAQDEAKLHARFIAFLLNPYASHGFEDAFFKLFLRDVLQTDFDCSNYSVLTAYQCIDLFIYNDSDAIIIANEIYAADRKHDDTVVGEHHARRTIQEGYKSQLERYYNTITTGVNSSGDKIDLQRHVVQVAYLTWRGGAISSVSLGNPPISCKQVSYNSDIVRWLKLCIDMAKTVSPILAADIRQYLTLVTNQTSNKL